MAAVTWFHSARIDALPARVFTWMTDLREDDHARPAFLRGAGAAEGGERSTRRILARSAGMAEVEDTWKGRTFRLRAVFDAENREVRVSGEYGYQSTWRAVPDGSGTRVEAEGKIAPGGLFSLLLPLLRKRFLRELEQDFRGHIADLEAELGTDKSSAGAR